MAPYCYDDSSSDNVIPLDYKLCYIGMHIGDSSNGGQFHLSSFICHIILSTHAYSHFLIFCIYSNLGHYYAYYYNFQEETWFKLDDTRVSVVDESAVLKDAFEGVSCAYMLQYNRFEHHRMIQSMKDDGPVVVDSKLSTFI